MCMCVCTKERQGQHCSAVAAHARPTHAHTQRTHMSTLHLVLGLRNALEQNQTRTIQQHFNYIFKKKKANYGSDYKIRLIANNNNIHRLLKKENALSTLLQK